MVTESLEGAANLDRTLGLVAKEMADLADTNQKAAETLLTVADPPRVSGALAASGHVVADGAGGTVTYNEVYAGVIHNGWPAHNIEAQPWLTEATASHRTELVDVYVDHVSDLLSQVQGI